MKTIFLFRHSIPDKSKEYINKEIPLSDEGKNKAKDLLNKSDFNNISLVYSSAYKRAIQTAQTYTTKIIIDERFNEREIGDINPLEENFWEKQYNNFDYKNINGESLNEVSLRMHYAINDILIKIKSNENVIVVSHATAICSYLARFCEIKVIDKIHKIRKIDFNGKNILLGKIDTPSCFVLEFNDMNELINIIYKEL